MGGYSQPWNEKTGISELDDPGGFQRKRGLLSAMQDAYGSAPTEATPRTSESPRLLDRMDDDTTRHPQGETYPEPDYSTMNMSSPGSSRSMSSDLDNWLKSRQGEYDRLSQPITEPALSTKSKILRGIALAAPVALGGAFGGGAGAAAAAAGAGRGLVGEMDANQARQDRLNAQREQERQRVGTDIGSVLRTREQEETADKRMTLQQEMENERARRAQEAQQPEHMDTDQGPIQYNRQTKQWEPISIGGQRVGPKAQQKPDTPEQQYIDEYQRTHNGATVAEAIAAYTRDTQKPEHEPRQLAVAPDGTVIELKPGMTVPAGTKTASKYGEPSADEQRRADLARNMSENLDQLEDIITRKPQLFGPVAGRMTRLKQMVGTGDPDVAKLAAIREYLGMASVGAHAMRNAQHVGAAADAVMAGFANSPEATKAAIQTARQSIATFQQDVGAEGSAPSPGSAGDVATRARRKGGKSLKDQIPGGGGTFQAPKDAPPAPREDGHKLKADGQVIAVSKGGQWVAP